MHIFFTVGWTASASKSGLAQKMYSCGLVTRAKSGGWIISHVSSGGAPGFLRLWQRWRCIERLHWGAGKTGGAIGNHAAMAPELVIQGDKGVFATFHPP